MERGSLAVRLVRKGQLRVAAPLRRIGVLAAREVERTRRRLWRMIASRRLPAKSSR